MYDKICKTCGTRLSSFYNTSMLGCPDCYKAFAREIEVALQKMQGKTFHVGKNLKSFDLDRELVIDYQRLVKEREQAGLEGRFDDMREYSAQIYELQEELKRRGLI